MRKTSTWIICALVVAGCFEAPSDTSVTAKITVDPDTQAQCIKVEVAWEGGMQVTPGVPRADSVTITVNRTAEMADALILKALGFAACDDAEPIEWGPTASITLLKGERKEVELRLGPVDKDGDGKLGSADCDDSNPTIPADGEICSDRVDNDCNGLEDCGDPGCTGGVCSATGGKCQDGTCREEVESLCGDGLDNDEDQRVDCEDTDCNQATCDDGKSCTQEDRCVQGQCEGTEKCESSPGQCFAVTGSCDPSGECQYVAAQGGACDDSNECTTGEVCLGDGGCAGQPIHGPACAGNAGVCESGTCALLAPFPYSTANFSSTIGNVQVNPRLTVSCPATIDTSVSEQSVCGSPVHGQLIQQTGNGPSALLLAVRELNVTQVGSLRVVGTNPLIIAVHGDAVIDGVVDVSSSTTLVGTSVVRDAGAGADTACASSQGANGTVYFDMSWDLAQWGGGGGGGYRATGGKGGDIRQISSSTGMWATLWAYGGDGGTPRGTAVLEPLVGGCPGGSGGNFDGIHGLGGSGGGAVQLAVAGKLILNRNIVASGAGGVGGGYKIDGSRLDRGGGGGGGSGGSIIIQASQLTLGSTARVTAHGGGGGQGGYGQDLPCGCTFGANGENGRSDTIPAAGGGSGWCSGGIGGTSGDAGVGENCVRLGDRGAGGGGGASGRIRIDAHGSCTKATGALISPPPYFGAQTCP